MTVVDVVEAFTIIAEGERYGLVLSSESGFFPQVMTA